RRTKFELPQRAATHAVTCCLSELTNSSVAVSKLVRRSYPWDGQPTFRAGYCGSGMNDPARRGGDRLTLAAAWARGVQAGAPGKSGQLSESLRNAGASRNESRAFRRG